MIIFIDFKRCFGVRKKSGISRRMLVVCYAKINGISDIVTSENAVLVTQKTNKWIHKMRIFLTIILCCVRKISQFIASPKKQTP